MITLTRFNKTRFVLNCEWIETVESTPDTVITTLQGKKYVVSESVDEIIEKVVEYKRICSIGIENFIKSPDTYNE